MGNLKEREEFQPDIKEWITFEFGESNKKVNSIGISHKEYDRFIEYYKNNEFTEKERASIDYFISILSIDFYKALKESCGGMLIEVDGEEVTLREMYNDEIDDNLDQIFDSSEDVDRIKNFMFHSPQDTTEGLEYFYHIFKKIS